MTLPEGWKVVDDETVQNPKKEEETKKTDGLPKGWKVVEDTQETKEEEEPSILSRLYEASIFSDRKGKKTDIKKLEETLKGAVKGATFGYLDRVPTAEQAKKKRTPEEEENMTYLEKAVEGAARAPFHVTDYLKEGQDGSLHQKIGEFGGSLIPLSGLVKMFSGPATFLASKSPVFQKQLSSLATMFAAGSSSKAIEQVAKGESPTAEDVLEHGLEWAAWDVVFQKLGGLGVLGQSLLKKSKETGLPRKQVLNNLTEEMREAGLDVTKAQVDNYSLEKLKNTALDILERAPTEAELAQGKKLELVKLAETKEEKLAQEALKPKPITAKDLKTDKQDPRFLKVQNVTLENPANHPVKTPEVYPLEGKDFRKESKALGETVLKERIESAGPRAASEQELGENIQKDIKANLKEKKSEYAPLYDEAEEAAFKLPAQVKASASAVERKLRWLDSVKTKPEGYGTTIKHLETLIDDLGYKITRNEAGKITDIKPDPLRQPPPANKLIEIGRRLNEIIDFEAPIMSVKDSLRSVVAEVKKDIRKSLEAAPDALAAWDLAEAQHAFTAAKFNKKTVRKLRHAETGEKAFKSAETPTMLEDLREVLTEKQMQQVEREYLEKLNKMSHEAAQKEYRSSGQHLTARNRNIAKDIIKSKDPHNPEGRTKLAKEGILDELATTATDGSRPTKTLQLWQDPQGQKLVKETFHNSPNWPEVKEFLENQSFKDMVSQVITDGHINMKKLTAFLKDPAMVNNIRSMGGEDAVVFFRGLREKVVQLEENAKRLLQLKPTEKNIEKARDLIKRSQETNKRKSKTQEVSKKEFGAIGERVKERGKAPKGQTRGEKMLSEIEKSRHPNLEKIKNWREWFTQTMGINEKGILSVFALTKLFGGSLSGIPVVVGTLIGSRLLVHAIKSPRIRKAFSEASKYHGDSFKFIMAMEHLGDVMNEEMEDEE